MSADRLWELLINEDHFEQAVEVLHMRPEYAAELIDRVRVEFDPSEDYIDLRPSLRVACALARYAPLQVHTLTVSAKDEGLDGLRHLRGLRRLMVWGPGEFDGSHLGDLRHLECIGARAIGRPGRSLEMLTATLDPSELGTWAALDWLMLTLTRAPTKAELQVLQGGYRWLGFNSEERLDLPWLPDSRHHAFTGFRVDAEVLRDAEILSVSDSEVLGEVLRLPRCRKATFDEDVVLPPRLVVHRDCEVSLAGQEVELER